MNMHAVITWIAATPASRLLAEWSIWLSPLCEAAHFIGLTLLIGAAGFVDLRLLGWMRSVPVATALEFVPWAVAGLVINLVSGVLFIGIDPSLYLNSATWWAKVAFLAVAAVNVMVFERTTLAARARAIGAGADTTPGMKAIGATSLAAWFMVLFLGRMLPYLGTAY
jgi:hypothetical protein